MCVSRVIIKGYLYLLTYLIIIIIILLLFLLNWDTKNKWVRLGQRTERYLLASSAKRRPLRVQVANRARQLLNKISSKSRALHVNIIAPLQPIQQRRRTERKLYNTETPIINLWFAKIDGGQLRGGHGYECLQQFGEYSVLTTLDSFSRRTLYLIRCATAGRRAAAAESEL